MRWSPVIAAFAVLVAMPASARAAGGPVAPVQDGAGIATAGSPFRYVASAAGSDTVIERVTRDAGRVLSTLRVSGRYGIPGVDYSGETTGLSADGRTLILAELPGSAPVRTTRLLVLQAPRLAVRARLSLRGWSTVDAISPDGRWLYLIHYATATGTSYEVRAYDLPNHRLLARPVVDPHDRGEAMTGFPTTRVMSAGGRWAYTFYDRPSGHPFVHALDTTALRAVCVDLPSLANTDLSSASLRLVARGAMLRIAVAGGAAAVIDTRTFAVERGGVNHATAPSRPAPRTGRGGGVPWEAVVLPIAALAAVGIGFRRRRGAHSPERPCDRERSREGRRSLDPDDQRALLPEQDVAGETDGVRPDVASGV